MPSKIFAVCVAGMVWLGMPHTKAEIVSTTLNLVNENDVNVLAVSLAIPQFETGNDTTRLSGTADATLQIDPATVNIDGLTKVPCRHR